MNKDPEGENHWTKLRQLLLRHWWSTVQRERAWRRDHIYHFIKELLCHAEELLVYYLWEIRKKIGFLIIFSFLLCL